MDKNSGSARFRAHLRVERGAAVQWWSAVLLVEDLWTVDGRRIVGGGTEWGALPLPLRAQSSRGTNEILLVGCIESIVRSGRCVAAAGWHDGSLTGPWTVGADVFEPKSVRADDGRLIFERCLLLAAFARPSSAISPWPGPEDLTLARDWGPVLT